MKLPRIPFSISSISHGLVVIRFCRFMLNLIRFPVLACSVQAATMVMPPTVPMSVFNALPILQPSRWRTDPTAVVNFVKTLTRLKEAASAALPEDADALRCPPPNLKIVVGETRISVDLELFKAGSGSLLYKSTDDLYIVKTVQADLRKIDPAELDPFLLASLEAAEDGIYRDKAFMIALARLGGIVIPKIFQIEPATVSASCEAHTLVAQSAGNKNLGDLLQLDLVTRMRILAKVAPRMLEIMRDVHKMGFVHGDIHPGNFAFSWDQNHDPDLIARSLRLVDFGRAEPFIGLDGFHLPEYSQSIWSSYKRRPAGMSAIYEESADKEFLSPWELMGLRKTRRDDFFRLAETLLRLAEVDGAYKSLMRDRVAQIAARLQGGPVVDDPEYKAFLIQSKTDRPFSNNVPQVLKDIYKTAISLRYDSAPPYDAFIHMLRLWGDSL